MLEARSLGVTLSGVQLLSAVDARVTPGRLLAVLGPNGAGKSTLLKCLSGVLTPSEGAVSLDGRSLADWPRRALARRRAVLPQKAPGGGFGFTARDLVLLGRAPHAGNPEAAPDTHVVAAALEATDAFYLAERDIETLSGGELQRVELARVLAQIWEARPPAEPGYLLLDEPTASLDLVQQARILTLARRFTAIGYGVLAIVHDLTAALELADDALLLSAGRVVAAGEAASVLQPDVLSEAYGAPLVRARLEGSDRVAILSAMEPPSFGA